MTRGVIFIYSQSKLEDVAEIFYGMVLSRVSSEHFENSQSYNYVTLKSVEDNKIDVDGFEKIETQKEINNKFLLKKHDILLKLSPPYNIAEIDFEPNKLIAPSTFAIIRILDSKILPRYISFLLTKKSFRLGLKKKLEGSSLPILKLSYIKEFSVDIKFMEHQKKYVELLNLILKKESLKKKVLLLESEYKNAILEKL